MNDLADIKAFERARSELSKGTCKHWDDVVEPMISDGIVGVGDIPGLVGMCQWFGTWQIAPPIADANIAFTNWLNLAERYRVVPVAGRRSDRNNSGTELAQ